MPTKKTLTLVEINWHPTVTVNIDEDWEYSTPDIPKECQERGLFYCIYGRHPVYGKDALLYIGETKPTNSGRSIRDRLAEHFKARFWNHIDLSISIGVPEDDLNESTVVAVESLLIAAHMPALNRKHIDKAIPAARGILVQNWGFRGDLLSECSGVFWC